MEGTTHEASRFRRHVKLARNVDLGKSPKRTVKLSRHVFPSIFKPIALRTAWIPFKLLAISAWMP
jgi:hypothetical protein